MSILAEDRPDWMSAGACRGKPPDWWFPDGECDVDGRALALCAACPVVDACRAWGIAHEKEGIWGGLTPRRRNDIRRRSGLRLQSVDMIVVADAAAERRERAASLWATGEWSAREIAVELGELTKTIHRWLDAAGFVANPPPWTDQATPAA